MTISVILKSATESCEDSLACILLVKAIFAGYPLIFVAIMQPHSLPLSFFLVVEVTISNWWVARRCSAVTIDYIGGIDLARLSYGVNFVRTSGYSSPRDLHFASGFENSRAGYGGGKWVGAGGSENWS